MVGEGGKEGWTEERGALVAHTACGGGGGGGMGRRKEGEAVAEG